MRIIDDTPACLAATVTACGHRLKADAYNDRYPHQMCGGERQRAMTVMALDPSVIIMDQQMAARTA